MKLTLNAFIVCFALVASGCGAKKNSSGTEMNSKFALGIFNDVNNPSTFDESALSELPRSVDLRASMTPVKNQDTRGTCSFFTAAALVESAIKIKMNVEVNLSEEYFSHSAKQNGYFSQEEGGTARSNLYTSVIKKKDFLLEKDWPYQPSWFDSVSKCYDFEAGDKKAPAECYAHNAPPESVMAKKIPSDKFEVYVMENGTINDIILEIATSKVPVSIAVPVNRAGWKNSGEVEYSEEMRENCIKGVVDCGSHEVVITGYDLDKKVFFFKNSWGKEWGDSGYGTFPIDMIDRHAKRSSVFVVLEEDIVLPQDHNVNPLELESFNISSKVGVDDSVKITTSGKIKNAGFNTIKIGTSLMMKGVGILSPIDDNNAEFVTLNVQDHSTFGREYISDGTVFLPEEDVGNFVLADKKYSDMNVRGDIMTSTSIKDLINDYRLLYFRTTLYMFTDDSGYKVLKRYYHTSNY